MTSKLSVIPLLGIAWATYQVCLKNQKYLGVGERVWRLRGFLTLPEDLSLVPNICVRWFTAAWNASSGDLMPFPGVCSYT